MSNKDIVSEDNAIKNDYNGMDKNVIIIFMISLIFVHVVGFISSYFRQDFGYDFGFFYRETYAFWSGGETYQWGFLYLNYFYFLGAWMYLLPMVIALLIHIFITELMFFYILKNIENFYQEWWIYGNIALLLWYSITFNTNIWIAFSFIVFQKYRDKWYSPFILLLAFYKITSGLAFGLLYLINFIFEKRIRWNQIPAFIIVLGIVGISYLTSTELHKNIIEFNDIVIFFQLPHFIWWSIPLMVFTEYRGYSIEKIKKIWIIFCIIEIIMGLTWLFVNENYKLLL